MSIEILAPAKVNLFLEVLNKRNDGYHELDTLMQSIDLSDKITIEQSHKSTSLYTNSDEVPNNDENLVIKAVSRLKEWTGIEDHVHISLEKHIPIGAGLGGGSSDALAVLLGLNKLWNLDLTRDSLCEISAPLGADVPYFLYLGLSLCRGIGHEVTRIDMEMPGKLLLINPGYGVSTQKIYKSLDSDLRYTPLDSRNVLNAIQAGDLNDIRISLFNRLEEKVLGLDTSLQKLKIEVEAVIGQQIHLTGSGSTFFSLLENGKDFDLLESDLKSKFRSCFIKICNWVY